MAVPLAASNHFRRVGRARPGAALLPFRGTLEPRKKFRRLMEAWREVRKSEEWIWCSRGARVTISPCPNPEQGLRILGAVPEEDLPALYSGALAFVYPSLYEGFGLPVLEAMQCGTTVITSRDPAIMEVSGGAAVHVDANDVRALVEAMRARPCAGERIASEGARSSRGRRQREKREKCMTSHRESSEIEHCFSRRKLRGRAPAEEDCDRRRCWNICGRNTTSRWPALFCRIIRSPGCAGVAERIEGYARSAAFDRSLRRIRRSARAKWTLPDCRDRALLVRALRRRDSSALRCSRPRSA